MTYRTSLTSVVAAAIWPGLLLGGDVAPQEPSQGSTEPDSGVVVEGVVVDHEAGDPLVGALVSLGAGAGVPGRGTRVTDEEGRFRYSGVPEGAYSLSVTAEGYQPMADTLKVAAKRDLDLILPLSKGAIRLAPIVVTAKADPGNRRNYERRHGGGSGFLVTREDIEKAKPRFITELLHRVPGGMVVPSPPHGYTLRLRAQCQPGIWVDGVQMHGATSIDQLVTPQVVEAIEVYKSNELPVEFGVNPCGGVLIWTRMGPTGPPEAGEEPRSGIFGQLLKAGVLVALVVLLTR